MRRGLPERGAERWMPPRELAEVGVAGGARRLGGYGDPAPRSACACLEFVFSERARLGFPRPRFVVFGKTLEFPVLLGEGRGGMGLAILTLRSEGWCSDRRPKHLRQRGPGFARMRSLGAWALAAARCGGRRRTRARGRLGGAGAAGPPGTSPEAWALPGAGVQRPEELGRKTEMPREEGRGAG